MILLTRTVPFLAGMATFLLFMLMLVWGNGLQVVSLVALAITAVTVATGRLTGYGRDLNSWWHVALTPGLFLLSVASIAVFIEQPAVLMVLFVLSSMFVFLFLEHLFRFVHLPGIYQPYALEHTSLVLHTASMYFFSVAGFGLQTFLRVNRWVLVVLFLIVAVLLIYEMMWVSKIRDKYAMHIAVAGGVLMAELFAIISWLPSSFYVSAAILGLLFYMFIGIMRAEQLQRLSSVVLRRYGILGVILLVILLATAQWT